MPWANNEALPDSVKVLPADAQTIFRSAANSALQDGKAEEVAIKIGWGAIKSAGWNKAEDGKWAKGNSESGDEVFAMDMEVFAAGTWNGDTFSEQDLQDIAKNFNELKDSVKPFLKLGGVDPHKDLVHQPAIGWVDSLRVSSGKLIASIKDIPKIVFEAIKRKLYRRVSSELYQGFKAQGKNYNYVLRAVALLGASVPAVSTLKDLTAYLSEQLSAESVKQFTFNEEDFKKMPDNDDALKIKEFEEKLKTEEAARKSAEEQLAKEQAEFKAFKEQQVKVLRDGNIEAIRAFCEEGVKAGKIPPFVRDAIFPKDKPPMLSFSEDNSVLLPFEVLRDVFSKTTVIDFSEQGVDGEKARKAEAGKGVGEIVDSRAKEFMKKDGIKNYSDAVQKVLAEDEKLAADYAIDRGKEIIV